jgi:hypothetical protein
MKVILTSYSDNGGQQQLLAESMRKYLGWDALNFALYKNPLGFKCDTCGEDGLEIAREHAKDADLYITQDALREDVDATLELIDPKSKKSVFGPKNIIINGTGTMMRNNLDPLVQMQLQGWCVIPPMCDDSISSHLVGVPFENWMVDTDKIDELVGENWRRRNNVVKVCHAPTKRDVKGTIWIEKVIQPLVDEGIIEYERITGVSWEEAIKRKSMCEIVLDSFGDVTATYGAGNALEGLAMGKTVISKISPWAYALHPDLPIHTNWGMNDKQTEELVREIVGEINVAGSISNELNADFKMSWVYEQFAPKYQIQRWKHFIDWMMSRKMG